MHLDQEVILGWTCLHISSKFLMMLLSSLLAGSSFRQLFDVVKIYCICINCGTGALEAGALTNNTVLVISQVSSTELLI